MAIRIRKPRDQGEYVRALAGIGHYFGGAWSGERAEEFARLTTHERMFAAHDGDDVVAGAGSVAFELAVPGGVLPCAGVTAVGVLPTHRRRGILGRLMRAQLEDIRSRGEPLAALWASEETIYRRYGYGLASQDVMIRIDRDASELHADLPRLGSVRLVEHDEALRVLPPLYDRIRRRTPGSLSRSRDWWELRKLDDRPERRAGAGELNRAVLEIGGRPVGYALYRVKFAFSDATNMSEVRVLEAFGETPEATREIWRFLLSIDWVHEIVCDVLPADHPLFLLVQRPNRLNWKVFDGLWLRIVDVEAALAGRSLAVDGQVTIDVCSDPLVPENIGTFTLADGAVRRTRRRADVRLDVQALASAYLGGFTFAELARAGRVEEVARGGIARTDAAFRVAAKPWCPEIF